MKRRVLVDFHIVCERNDPYAYMETLEMQAKYAEQWGQEFEDFIRDHRSQDNVQIRVVREYEDRCHHCDYLWELDPEDGCPTCCQTAIEEWERHMEIEKAGTGITA